MKIISIRMSNFRGISDIQLSFDPQLNIFSGINGSGKTSILDALAKMLSWMTARIRNSKSSGQHIDILDIKNSTSECEIEIKARYEEDDFTWSLIKTKPGRKKDSSRSSHLKELTHLVEGLQFEIEFDEEELSIPLLAYYPIHRVVKDIPLRIRKKHNFNLLDAYEGSLTSGADFRTFFEWFREREDLENENRKFKELAPASEKINYEVPDRQLHSVRTALQEFLPGFTHLSVRRNPLRMVVYKDNQELWVNQLSDGEKCLIALVGDLARRLAIANPALSNPLAGHGVVLIDEIDLHLHPSWQRMVVPALALTFPNCQFFITTHSPQILSEIPPEKVWLLHHEEGSISFYKPEQTFGLDSSTILEELMQTQRRNQATTEKLNTIANLIDEEKFNEARKEIQYLKNILQGSIPELIEAESLISMLEG